MPKHPEFPHFKNISLQDRDTITAFLKAYQPETSELTFTNLFMWQAYARTRWSVYRDWLCMLCRDKAGRLYAMPPIGPPSRRPVSRMILEWLGEEKRQQRPCIQRADKRLAQELGGAEDFLVEPKREHFDYIYRVDNLSSLSGRKYHGKKNHVNKFREMHSFTYAPLDQELIRACLELENQWCRDHHCCEDMSLMGEWEAIRNSLLSFRDLRFEGGAIQIDGKVEAFTFGELLNADTAVVHVEKANPAIQGLYAVINQQFCENSLDTVSYVNREQDLGQPGLRQAKQSYHPSHLVEKFTIRCKHQ